MAAIRRTYAVCDSMLCANSSLKLDMLYGYRNEDLDSYTKLLVPYIETKKSGSRGRVLSDSEKQAYFDKLSELSEKLQNRNDRDKDAQSSDSTGLGSDGSS